MAHSGSAHASESASSQDSGFLFPSGFEDACQILVARGQNIETCALQIQLRAEVRIPDLCYIFYTPQSSSKDRHSSSSPSFACYILPFILCIVLWIRNYGQQPGLGAHCVHTLEIVKSDFKWRSPNI